MAECDSNCVTVMEQSGSPASSKVNNSYESELCENWVNAVRDKVSVIEHDPQQDIDLET